MRRRNRKVMYLVFGALILMVSVGYAVLSANLTINGVSRIANARWDVHFENVRATNNSNVIPTTAPSAPAASKATTISYVVNLDEPGDIYEFLVDVVNAGAIDAKFASLSSKIKIDDGALLDVSPSTLPSYLIYTVTMGDGSAIVNDHNLLARQTETYKIHVEFKMDITNEELEAAQDKSITLNVGLNYVQADNSGMGDAAPSAFTTFGEVVLNQTIPNNVDTYETPALAMNSFTTSSGSAKPFYFYHVLDEQERVSESYLQFVVSAALANDNEGMTPDTYIIQGDIDEENSVDKDVYVYNKGQLETAFGQNNCYEYGFDQGDGYGGGGTPCRARSAQARPGGT